MADIQNLEGIVFSPEVKLPTENGVGAVQPIVFSGTILFYTDKESFPIAGDASLLFIDTKRKQLYKWNDETNGYEAITMSKEETEGIFALKQEGVYYVAGNTTGTKGVWTGTNDRITEYYDGLVINYKVGIEGASTTTLNINNLGAKTVYLRGTTKVTTHYGVGTMVLLSYNAAKNAFYTSDYDANNYAYVRQYTTKTAGEYPLLFAYETTLPESYDTKYTRKNADITANPSTGSISATEFIEDGTTLAEKYAEKEHTHTVSDITDFPEINDGVLTLQSSEGLVGAQATFSANDPNDVTFSVQHAVPDGAASGEKTGSKIVGITTDKFGHITKVTTDIDSDEKVKQSATTTNKWRKIILSSQASTDPNSPVIEDTNYVYATPNIEAQASTGDIRSSGSITATKHITTGSSNKYVVLGDGSTKAISDFAMGGDIPDVSDFVTKSTAQTITGIKTFVGQTVIKSSAATGSADNTVNGFKFLTNTGNYVGKIASNDGGALGFYGKTALYFRPVIDSAGKVDTSYGVTMNNTGLFPGSTKMNLGTSTSPWGSLYATTLYENGVALANKYLQTVNLPSISITDTTNRKTHPFIGSLEADGHTITVNRQTLKDVGLNTVYRFRGTCTWDDLLNNKDSILGDVWNIKKEDDEGNPIVDPEGNIGADWVCYREEGIPSSGIEPSQYEDWWQSLGGYVDLSNYVEGPETSTKNSVARFDDTGGKSIKDSNVTIADTGSITIGGTWTGISASNPYLSMGGYAKLTANTAGAFTFSPGNTTTYLATTTEFRPVSDLAEKVDLGSANYAWRNIYAKTLYEGGKALNTLYADIDHKHSADNIEDLDTILSDYVLKTQVATSTTLGLVKLGSNTKQTSAANGVTSTTGRTYAVQLNNNNQMVVNVPWTDENDNTWRPIECGNVSLEDSTTTLKFKAGTNITLTFKDGELTINGPGDNKVLNTLNTTTKYYVTGTTNASTNTGTQIFDTGVYVSETAGALHATTYNIDTNATMKYDSATQCIRFVIN